MKKDTKNLIKFLKCETEIKRLSDGIVGFAGEKPTEAEVISRCMLVFEAILSKSLKLAKYSADEWDIGVETKE